MRTISNKDQVEAVTREPTKMFKGPGGPTMAAIMIQKTWRYYKAFSNFKQLKFLMEKARKI